MPFSRNLAVVEITTLSCEQKGAGEDERSVIAEPESGRSKFRERATLAHVPGVKVFKGR